MSHSQAFYWKQNMSQDSRAYFITSSSEGESAVCALLAPIRKAQVQLLSLKHIIQNTLFASITPTSENEVIHGIKCGNYTMGAYLTF